MAKIVISLLLLCLAVAIPSLKANPLESEEYWLEHSNEFDSYWQERAKVAKQVNQAAYFPDPFAVSGNLTAKVTE